MLSLISFLIVLSVLIIVHELGHHIAAKLIGVKVERFSLGFGPKLLAKRLGDTEYALSSFPLGGYVKLAGDTPGEERKNEPWEFLSRPAADRFMIVFAGPLLNYILAFLLFSLVFMMGYPNPTTKIGKLLDGYPAASSGLKAGDRVVSVNGAAVRYWKDMTEIIHKKVDGNPIKFAIERHGARFEIDIRPVVEERKDIFGNVVRLALTGIAPSDEVDVVRHTFFGSFYEGARELLGRTALTYRLIWSMVTGRVSMKGMTGPIGIYMITGEAARLGIVYLLYFMAILSMSLAVFNFLPIPVLDGGHVIFLIIEKLMGRPLSEKAQEKITNAGLAVLVLLMALVFYNDIMRFELAQKALHWFRR